MKHILYNQALICVTQNVWVVGRAVLGGQRHWWVWLRKQQLRECEKELWTRLGSLFPPEQKELTKEVMSC